MKTKKAKLLQRAWDGQLHDPVALEKKGKNIILETDPFFPDGAVYEGEKGFYIETTCARVLPNGEEQFWVAVFSPEGKFIEGSYDIEPEGSYLGWYN